MPKDHDEDDAPAKPHLSIENLLQTLEIISKDSTRLSRAGIDNVFRTLRVEMPYSMPLINANLALALFADAPRHQTDTTLNDVVVNLSKVLINPSQTAGLHHAIQTYYQARRRTEKDYAAEQVSRIIAANPLTGFPETTWKTLEDLTLTIIDRIVMEKISRRVPGYPSQSVLEIVKPFLQFRLANADLEKIKLTQPDVFKRWLTDVALHCYETLNDEKKFAQIQQEKRHAFAAFKTYVATKSQNKANLARFIEKISFSQQDKNKKIHHLERNIDKLTQQKSFLTPAMVSALRFRLQEKLRKLFAVAKSDPAVYQSEETLLAAQDKAFLQIENDCAALEMFVQTFTDIEINFSKNMLAAVLGRSQLSAIKQIGSTCLLGPVVNKRDTASGEIVAKHEGGFSQKTTAEIYRQTILALQQAETTAQGLLSTGFKAALRMGIVTLESAQTALPPEQVSTTTALPSVAEVTPVIPVPASSESIPVTAPPPHLDQSKLTTPEPFDTVDTAPAGDTTPAIVDRAAKPDLGSGVDEDVADENMEDRDATQPEFVTPLAIESKYEATAAIDDGTVESALESELDDELAEENVDETAAFQLEPVTPQVMESEFEALEAEFQLEPVKLTAVASDSEGDPGSAIMKHYDLGDFKEAVHEAWKVILVQAVNSRPNEDLQAIAQDQAVNFYVICELVQKVAAFSEERQSPANKEILISIQTLLLAALKDPLEENNWTFFEGSRRDDVDKAIAMLTT